MRPTSGGRLSATCSRRPIRSAASSTIGSRSSETTPSVVETVPSSPSSTATSVRCDCSMLTLPQTLQPRLLERAVDEAVGGLAERPRRRARQAAGSRAAAAPAAPPRRRPTSKSSSTTLVDTACRIASSSMSSVLVSDEDIGVERDAVDPDRERGQEQEQRLRARARPRPRPSAHAIGGRVRVMRVRPVPLTRREPTPSRRAAPRFPARTRHAASARRARRRSGRSCRRS